MSDATPEPIFALESTRAVPLPLIAFVLAIFAAGVASYWMCSAGLLH